MGDEPVSDAVFGLRGACKHSVRFTFGAPLNYPYAPQVAIDNPPPAVFRRVQAASPPPGRDGATWATGMTLDGRAVDPAELPEARIADVTCADDVSSLDVPDAETIVLDQYFSIPQRRQEVTFGGEKTALASINYWSPIAPGETEATRTVDYYDEFRMDWKREPADRWVAISFDAFWPPERDSAELIIPLGACDASCPA